MSQSDKLSDVRKGLDGRGRGPGAMLQRPMTRGRAPDRPDPSAARVAATTPMPLSRNRMRGGAHLRDLRATRTADHVNPM